MMHSARAIPILSDKIARVLHVVLQLDMGGMEKLLVDIARFSDRKRFDHTFVCISRRGALADQIEEAGRPVICLDEPIGLRLSLARRLYRLFRTVRPDVVHTHNSKPLIYAAPAARLARVPCIVHTRHGQRFNAPYRQTLAVRVASQTLNRFVCVSEDSKKCSKTEGIAAKRLVVIRNGVDLTRFAYTGPSYQRYALMVGRLVPEKNIESLLRSMQILTQELPEFRLIIAGDGPSRASLESMATDLQLGERVKFLGTVADIASLMSGASLFVLPSLTEGISLTLLEAMATGLPVVATAVGGNPEVVADRETGFLVPPKSPRALADAMTRLWNEPALARELGAAGRARVEQRFDIRDTVTAYQDLYVEILGKPEKHVAREALQMAESR
jgi:sugar transferase (PEP-CTERM/EpsH1 system associated)